MIWVKTDAGRAEMQERRLVRERAQRNLLLLIDGQKSEAMLLANVTGIAADDFRMLQALGLITPAAARPGAAAPKPAPAPTPSPAGPPAATPAPAAPAAPLDYAQFTTALTQLISKQLGLRGFPLTLAVEKAASIDELKAVAERTLAQIRERKGEAAYETARRTLYG